MRLLRIELDGFGALRGAVTFDPERLTLVVDDNERGKSTLLAAIVAALYGLERDQRHHRVLTPHDRWRPWDGEGYRVALELECGGERWNLRRDFERDTVEAWDGHGRERTEEFREGKDQYPFGKALLGLDAAEFEKCAFLKQGDLDRVVPEEERDRRASTLRERLEAAADSRAGDASATEALRVLDLARCQYECPEISANPIKMDTAVSRLALAVLACEERLGEVEVDLRELGPKLEEIAELVAREQSTRARLAALEAERARARGAEIDALLARDDDARAECLRLESERDGLVREPRLDAEAAAELRALSGRLEAAEQQIAVIAAHQAEAALARRALEQERDGLAEFEPYAEADADRLASLAEELRRADTALEQSRRDLRTASSDLASRGFPPDRVAVLERRFGSLAPDHEEMLKSRPETLLGFQTRSVAIAERRDAAVSAIASIDAARRRRAVPGWLTLGLGVSAAIAAGVAGMLDAAWPWLLALAASGGLAAIGAVALALAAATRRKPRRAAVEALAAAEDDLGALRGDQIAHQQRLETIALGLGIPAPEALIEDWSRYRDLVEADRTRAPVEERRRAIERRRVEIAGELAAILRGDPAAAPDPESLESVVSGIRRIVGLASLQAAGEGESRRLEEDRARLAESIDGLRSRAGELLLAAGLPFTADRPLAQQIAAAGAAVERDARVRLLLRELIPAAIDRLLDGDARARLEHERAGSAAAAAGGGAPRPALEIEAEIGEIRETIESIARRREELRARYEELARRRAEEHAEKLAELEALQCAQRRAERFKAAIDLAHDTLERVAWDTHRRWAAFLNHRVGGILQTLGTEIAEVRFGEDLDFSVGLSHGHRATRGRALLQLSSGARDQLHLAVRVAISEFLSRADTPLPLLVDDAFATSDDRRAGRGLAFLVGLQGHQVILATCHRGRYEALARDPDLGGRVHWVDLTRITADRRAEHAERAEV